MPDRVIESGSNPVTDRELDAMLDEFYDASGFTIDGIVPEQLLIELGIK